MQQRQMSDSAEYKLITRTKSYHYSFVSWRQYLRQSEDAIKYEEKLSGPPFYLKLVEHCDGRLASTAHTDVEQKTINLDVTQPPLKAAMSYAYELKNFDNIVKHERLEFLAKHQAIRKAVYVKSILEIEAEAIYFRCKFFRTLGVSDNEFPNKRAYLELYDSMANLPEKQVEKRIHQYMLENGVVRNAFSAKKFYADSYDFYAGKKDWPAAYDEKSQSSCIRLEPEEQKIADTQKDMLHPAQCLFLMFAAYDFAIQNNIEAVVFLSYAFSFEKIFLSITTLDHPEKASVIKNHAPRNYSFLTKIGEKISSAVTKGVEIIDTELQKRLSF